ncbi:MAG TPA: hypothetical protein VMV47_08470 [Bacteroidales bacterium]|nr:hypothetical protein [Bacteroidales bacterium]
MFSIFKELKTYLETKYDVTRLDITEKIIVVSTLMLQLFVFVLLSSIILLFLSFAFANYIGDYWDNTSIGFLILSGINTLLLLIIIIFRKTFIIKPVSKILIQILLTQHKENEDEDEEEEENDI